MATAPVNAALAAFNRIFHKPKQTMHDDDPRLSNDYESYYWPQDTSSNGTATRAHPRPTTKQQGEYPRQQQLAIVTTTQPILFDMDPPDWHQSAAQFEAQQRQQFELNPNNPSLSPASSFSSLSPTQVSLPLAPAVQPIQQHPGPPLTPLSTASMSPTSTPSASTSLPATYSFPSGASPYMPHTGLRRAATSSTAMPPSPSSPSAPYHHHQHQRHASANGYHPYAANGRYQPHHQPQHRRSPLHQQQASRSSPLGHQPGFVPEDFAVDPVASFGGQMARTQGAVVQGGYPVQQQSQQQYGQAQPFETKQFTQQCYPQHQQRLSPSLYPTPPPPHPHLQHIPCVHIPAYTGPTGHGHGPRSASSSSTSSHVTASTTSSNSNSNSSASSSSYGPGTPLSVGSSAGSNFPSSESLAGLNLGGGSNEQLQIFGEMGGCATQEDGGVDLQAVAAQQHFVSLAGGMGMGMGMDVDGLGGVGGVDPLDMDMGGMGGYMNPVVQHHHQHSPQHRSPIVVPSGISPQLVMLDGMPNHLTDSLPAHMHDSLPNHIHDTLPAHMPGHMNDAMHDTMPGHTHIQQQIASLFDTDEASPIDAAYAEYAAASAAAAASGEVYVVMGQDGTNGDPRGSMSLEVEIMENSVESFSLTQQRLEQHQQAEQRTVAAGVVQEWQRMGREYDSADSDSDEETEGSEDEDDEDGAYEGEDGGYNGYENGDGYEGYEERGEEEVAKEEVQEKKGRKKASNAKGSTNTSTPPTSKTSSSSNATNSKPTAKAAATATRQVPSSFRRAVPTKRASTRTITPATVKTSRSRASTQTLTQRNVRGANGGGGGTVQQEKNGMTQQEKNGATQQEKKEKKPRGAVDMGEDEGEVDAEGEADEDAEGEDDEGMDGMVLVNGVSGREEDEKTMHSAEEDEDGMSTDESSFDYDDEKDGEFVLRSRSRSRPAAARAARRGVGGESASAAKRGGRTLRNRTSSGVGSASGRYNPYSTYANDQVSASAAASAGGVISSSIHGLRTLSATLANAGVSIGDGAPGSPTLSTSSYLSTATEVHSASKQRKVRPPTNLPVPVPVPNLTKKSRGRRVPTVNSLEELRKVAGVNQDGSASSSGAGAGGSSGGGSGRGRRRAGGAASGSGTATGSKGARMYLCDVEGCGKCFARGEHLKRHVRSIHTNEKPHTCPYPGCGKDFSRHDNLGQHMRVHKDYVPPHSVKASSP